MQIFSGLSPRSNAVKRGHQTDGVSGLELIHQLNARLTVSQSRATTHPLYPVTSPGNKPRPEISHAMASGTSRRKMTSLECRRRHRVASNAHWDIGVRAYSFRCVGRCARGMSPRRSNNRGSAEKKTREHCALITLLSAR